MDTYTDPDTIIAWTDSDTVFTIPVMVESIIRNGKLIVKGMNTLRTDWNQSTAFTLGLPPVSDFMTFFPVYVHARTLRNCRHYIMHRLKSKTFAEAFIKMVEFNAFISPVNIVLSYAYYFERDLYDWHIDVGNETLESYNMYVLPPEFPLLETDLTPEIHVTVHTKYVLHSNEISKPLEEAICFTQIALNMTNIPHCDKFRHEINLQLFQFQYLRSHINTWCAPGPKRDQCKKLIDDHNNIWLERYRKDRLRFNTTYLGVIEDFAKINYGIDCYYFKYSPYI